MEAPAPPQPSVLWDGRLPQRQARAGRSAFLTAEEKTRGRDAHSSMQAAQETTYVYLSTHMNDGRPETDKCFLLAFPTAPHWNLTAPMSWKNRPDRERLPEQEHGPWEASLGHVCMVHMWMCACAHTT